MPPTPTPNRFAQLTNRTLAAPRFTLAITLILLLASVGITVSQLTMHTSRQDLLNPDSPFNQRWLRYVAEFGDEADVVVVVESREPQQVTRAIDRIGQSLRQRPDLFRDVLDQVRSEALQRKALHYLSESELRPLVGWTIQARTVLANPSAQAEDYDTLLNGFPTDASRVKGREPEPLPPADPIQQLQTQLPRHVLARQGTIGLVAARLQATRQQFVPDAKPLLELERIRSETLQAMPEIRIGITGLPALEFGEMQTSQRDMTWASCLSLLGVTALFWAGFGGVKYPLLGVVTLLTGLAWTCGYLTLVVGHLNILSMSFGVILIGLGIDFALHFVARYLEEIAAGGGTRRSLITTSASVGPPILAGGVTTAAAFFATSWTEFRGVAELGIISGGGILLCVAATLFILPPLIWLVDARQAIPPARQVLHVARLNPLLWRRPSLFVAASLAATAFLATGLPQLRFDHNLLNLQAADLPCVQWEQKLLQETDRSTWFAVSMADTQAEVLRRKASFERLATVARVEEIASLLPNTTPAAGEAIAQIHQALAELPPAPPVVRPLNENEISAASRRRWRISLSGGHDGSLRQPDTLADRDVAARIIELNVGRAQRTDRLWQRGARGASHERPPSDPVGRPAPRDRGKICGT